MLSVRGYFKENQFIAMDNAAIPEGKQVIVTILDDAVTAPDPSQQRGAFADFFSALKADTEEPTPVFNEIAMEKIKLREYDWS